MAAVHLLDNEVYFSKEDWPYYALGIEILKARKIHIFLLIARNYREAKEYNLFLIVMGVQIQKGSF